MTEQADNKHAALQELRERCEADLWVYACTVEPHRVYGECHKELFRWWQYEENAGIENMLALLPRDHQKSHCAAVWASWKIVENPATTIIYMSATAELAERQLDDIKQMMEAKPFQMLWPEMVHPIESQRAMWNNSGIKVDHPKRKEEGVRDPTISTAGMTTNTTGWHATILVKDDVVIPENAYTEEGRRKVEAKCSQLSSILTTGGIELVVGTRYHPRDHYNTIKEMVEEVCDDDGGVIDKRQVYAVMERQVETNGVFLWPRVPRESDGKMFGFDWAQLNRKKAKYTDKRQFYAQYYNNPNNMDKMDMTDDMFSYYSRSNLKEKDGAWFIGEEPLALYAAMDFAYSKTTEADYTSLVVVGISPSKEIYILDLVRFKTDKYETYFKELSTAWDKWGFSKVLLETTAAQVVIANYIKDRCVDEHIKCKVFHHKPNKYSGAKEERIEAVLKPLYEDNKIYHYRSGITNMLEEELKLDNPPHDDLKDVLAAVIGWEKAKPARKPAKDTTDERQQLARGPRSRFGGYA